MISLVFLSSKGTGNENESSASGDCADKKPQGGSSYGHWAEWGRPRTGERNPAERIYSSEYCKDQCGSRNAAEKWEWRSIFKSHEGTAADGSAGGRNPCRSDRH